MKTISLNEKRLIIFCGILILMAGIIGCTGHKGSQKRQGAQQGQPPSKEQLFNQFDKDNDARLSKEEFPGPDDHFTQLDRNSDGYLEKDEVPDGPPSGKKRG